MSQARVVSPTAVMASGFRPVGGTQPGLQPRVVLPAPVTVGAAQINQSGATDIRQLCLAINNPNVLQYYAGALFAKSDVNKDGMLSIDELERLIPALHQELGLEFSGDEEDQQRLVRARMQKFDKNGDSMLSQQEFVELYRWSLWRKYEDLNPPKFRRGDVIGRARNGAPAQFYCIGKQLGAGSFGIVHQVSQRSSGNERVMKTVNKDKVVESGTPIAMITQEIDLLALLDHPHILRLFEWFNDSQNIYIILDMCRGGELLDLIKESADRQWPLPESWIARIFRQSLEAIGYCHAKGVMHKDLKFENIMLQTKVSPESRLEDVIAVVIDVGLAELFGPQHGKGTRSKLRAGSLATMAPEVIKGDFSYKCDIWSLGCMIFAIYNAQPFYIPDEKGGQILYMYPFFPSATETDPMGVDNLLQAQQRGPPLQQMPTANANLLDLVTHMLQFHEQLRPTALDCVGAAWFSEPANQDSESCGVLQFQQHQLDGLLHDRNHRMLWRAATLQAAAQLPGAKIEPLARIFHQMDRNSDGFIDKQELSNGLCSIGVGPLDAEKAATAADFDGDGRIEWSEFVASCLPAARELFAVSLQAAFQNVDRDNDGVIDSAELAELLSTGQLSSTDMPTSKAVETMLAELDVDRNGRVSWHEFQDYFAHADLLEA